MKCCFCGHGRDWEIPNSVIKLIPDNIENLIINYNVDTFLTKGMGEFDRLCGSAVRKLKKHILTIN